MKHINDDGEQIHHIVVHKAKKPWYKRFWVWVIIIIFASVIWRGTTGQSSTNTASSSSTTSASASVEDTAQANTAPTPKIGQAANDGKFAFTISSLTCDQSSLSNDNEFETSTAHGQFCVMKLTVKGIGTQAQQFDDSSQYLYTSDGTQYSVSSDGTTAANPSGQSDPCWSYPTINPGVSVSCNLAYDIPAGVTPAYAVLRDSSFSHGVKVSAQ